MQESKLERKLRLEVCKRGGLAYKFTSPNVSGVPDRLVLLPNGRAIFVEMKAPGGVLRPLQKKRRNQLENLGFSVYVVDSNEAIRDFIQEVMSK